jgi:hypothetical protein
MDEAEVDTQFQKFNKLRYCRIDIAKDNNFVALGLGLRCRSAQSVKKALCENKK